MLPEDGFDVLCVRLDDVEGLLKVAVLGCHVGAELEHQLEHADVAARGLKGQGACCKARSMFAEMGPRGDGQEETPFKQSTRGGSVALSAHGLTRGCMFRFTAVASWVAQEHTETQRGWVRISSWARFCPRARNPCSSCDDELHENVDNVCLG